MHLHVEPGNPSTGFQHFHCGQVAEGEVPRYAGVAHIIGLQVRLQVEVGLEVGQGKGRLMVGQGFQSNPGIDLNRQSAELGFQVMKRFHLYIGFEFKCVDLPGVRGLCVLKIRMKFQMGNLDPVIYMKTQRE